MKDQMRLLTLQVSTLKEMMESYKDNYKVDDKNQMKIEQKAIFRLRDNVEKINKDHILRKQGEAQ
jgi:hypothetical protein